MAVMGSSTGGDKNTRLTGNHKSGKLDLGLEKKKIVTLRTSYIDRINRVPNFTNSFFDADRVKFQFDTHYVCEAVAHLQHNGTNDYIK